MTRSEWAAQMGLAPIDGDDTPVVHELWHDFYFQAFDALRDDRSVYVGQFGYLGESGIFYRAISQYCRDLGIAGAAAQKFAIFIHAIDAENRIIAAEQRERESSSRGNHHG